jgi:hypothetical protein
LTCTEGKCAQPWGGEDEEDYEDDDDFEDEEVEYPEVDAEDEGDDAVEVDDEEDFDEGADGLLEGGGAPEIEQSGELSLSAVEEEEIEGMWHFLTTR